MSSVSSFGFFDDLVAGPLFSLFEALRVLLETVASDSAFRLDFRGLTFSSSSASFAANLLLLVLFGASSDFVSSTFLVCLVFLVDGFDVSLAFFFSLIFSFLFSLTYFFLARYFLLSPL